jgi:hypothetical protein
MTNEEAIVKLAHAVATVGAQVGATAAVAEAHDVVRALAPVPETPDAAPIEVAVEEAPVSVSADPVVVPE